MAPEAKGKVICAHLRDLRFFVWLIGRGLGLGLGRGLTIR
jgi:hypothetical protein